MVPKSIKKELLHLMAEGWGRGWSGWGTSILPPHSGFLQGLSEMADQTHKITIQPLHWPSSQCIPELQMK